MNTASKNGYPQVFRSPDWPTGRSPKQMPPVAGQWMTGFQRLAAEGRAVAGNPLEREGKFVSGKNGRMVADGPFAESKEAIGGDCRLNAGSSDEAAAIAQERPGLPFGVKVGVRPVTEPCPLSKAAAPAAQFAEMAA